MIKTGIAIAIIAAFAAGPASAATDCNARYDDFWEKMRQYGNSKPKTEDVVATHRMGLRAFDACQAGDEANFANFWEKMRQYGNAKDDAEKFWTELQKTGAAKK